MPFYGQCIHYILRHGMRPGFKLPRRFAFLQPEPAVSWGQAVDDLRAAVDRAETHRMTHPSPVFGRLSHEQWVRLHCRHAEMHFGFLKGS